MKEKTNEELVQMLANARTTQYECFGHAKSDNNAHNAKIYEQQLKNRGVKVPDIDELLIIGRYNGIGSA